MSEALPGNALMSDRETNTSEPAPASSSPDHGSPGFASATAPSYGRTLFFDSEGLRPGWGLLFYGVTFFFLQSVFVELVWSHDLGASGMWGMALEEFGNFLAAVIPSLVLAKIESRRWGSYGLPLRKMVGPRFWTGTIWGFSAVTLLMVSLYSLHDFSFGHLAVHGGRLIRFAGFWAVFFLLVGLFEEFWVRGYAQFTLTRGVGFWPSALLLSVAFGLFHLRNQGEHWPGILGAIFIALFFCFTLRRTGNLWFAVGFHAAWDWGETFFYSVPDSGSIFPGHLLQSSLRGPNWISGGSVGPEGSVLCFVVISLVWIVFGKSYPGNLPAVDRTNGLLK